MNIPFFHRNIDEVSLHLNYTEDASDSTSWVKDVHFSICRKYTNQKGEPYETCNEPSGFQCGRTRPDLQSGQRYRTAHGQIRPCLRRKETGNLLL